MLYGVEEMFSAAGIRCSLTPTFYDWLPNSNDVFKQLQEDCGAMVADVVFDLHIIPTVPHIYMPAPFHVFNEKAVLVGKIISSILSIAPYPALPKDDNLSITWRAHMSSQGFASVPVSNAHDEVVMTEPHRVYQMTVSMSPMRLSGEQRRIIADLVRRQAAELAATLQMMVTDKQARVQCTVESASMGLKRIDLTL